ncbi:hypothetical protein HYV44_03115 [Candidatus Microgenomates bacterium]|nr:hypothetical protein [Candidatus Microgenomates bacterium]
MGDDNRKTTKEKWILGGLVAGAGIFTGLAVALFRNPEKVREKYEEGKKLGRDLIEKFESTIKGKKP